jgi:hypothetical protein
LRLSFLHISLIALLTLARTVIAQDIPVFRPAEALTLTANGIKLRQPFAGGMHSGQFFMFDVNADGDEDLVVFDRAGDVIKVFTTLAGQYVYQPDLAQFFPADLENWIILVDYDCDGQKDLFTYSSFGVRIFVNTSSVGEYPAWGLTEDPLFTKSGNNTVNLLVNPSDIPSIQDIDGDGDIDILAFNFSSGQTAELYENRSVDNTGNCGLDYVRTNQRWGDFSECNCDNYQFEPFTCADPSSRTMHIEGKAFLVADINGDGRRDALIGQETCDGLTYLINEGTDADPLFVERNLYLPNFSPSQGAFFPSTFLADFNKDGQADLILSSNHREDLAGLDYRQSSFLLANEGTSAAPDFAVPEPFLQNEMFDVGENAVPVAYDATGDGRPDLLIANKGLPAVGGSFRSTITLLQNKGNGSFEQSTADWMGLSQLGLTNLSFQLVDMNGDGHPDLVLKGYGLNTFGLKIFWIPNQDNTFSASEALPLTIEINATDYPYFYDINGNGRLDLLLGQSNGRLSLWLNSGTNIAPIFTTKTDAYLGIDRTPDRTFLVPLVVNEDGNSSPDLLMADNSGTLRVIHDFTTTGTTTPEVIQLYNATLDATQPLKSGRRLWPALADLTGDNANELIIGTAQGGLLAFTATNEQGNPGNEVKLRVNVFPNPLETERTLRVTTNLEAVGILYNVSGQRLSGELHFSRTATAEIDLSNFPTGLYLLRIRSGSQAITKRIIVGP